MSTSRTATEHETEDLVVLSRQVVIALMQAADGARRAMTRALAAFDLTLSQYNVLTVLRKHEELPTFQVAARMVEAAPGITRLVSTLEAKRYVRRTKSNADRRQQLCSLTPQGRRVVDSATPPFSVIQQRIIGDLSRAEAQHTIALLRRVAPHDVTSRGREPLSRRASRRITNASHASTAVREHTRSQRRPINRTKPGERTGG